jgi:hypothetical protein
MHHIVYNTIHLPTGQYYIGVHSCKNLDDSYLGSGNRIKRMAVKYGRQQFHRQTLQEFSSRADALSFEHQIITSDLLLDPLCLNISVGSKGNPLGGHGISEQSRVVLSILHRGKQLSTITKQRISASKQGQPSPLEGTPRPDDVRKKISAGLVGKLVTNETRQKISAQRKGIPRSEETKRKISEANRGKVMSEDVKQKMRKPKQKATCPSCGQVGGISQMKRWHFSNCSVTSSNVLP